MSKEKLEQISALVDDELEYGFRFVLRTLHTNEEYKGIWGRYHLIGECLRGHLPAYIDMHLARRINEALHNEPATHTSQRFPRLRKSVAGLAIAASVAAIAIMGVRQMGSGPAATASPPVAYNQSGNTAEYQTVTVTSAPMPERPVLHSAAPDDAQSRLNRYLVNYNEYRANTGVQGTLPYVRIVAHEVEE